MHGPWKRRLFTIPGVFLAFLVTSVLFPLLAAGALLVDLGRWLSSRRPFVGLRILSFAWFYLAGQVIGLGALFWVWARSSAGRTDLVLATFSVQERWASTLFRATSRLFGLSLDVEGEAALSPGPFIVFIRHASVIDTLLPTVLITARHGIRLRFVLKRELLLDPCLDVAGLRLPNFFVRRTGEDKSDVEGVSALGRDLGPSDGVLLYPEGTRFTADKQRRALARLRSETPEIYALAKDLTQLMPPRLGGALALLESAKDADVVFLVHHGLDGFAKVSDIFLHALAKRRVTVKVWRVERSQIPAAEADRVRWLFEQWQKADDWVAARSRET